VLVVAGAGRSVFWPGAGFFVEDCIQLRDGGQECCDRAGFRRFLREEQPGLPGPGDERAVSPALHLPATGFVAGWQGGDCGQETTFMTRAAMLAMTWLAWK
jgi:hypothetical protein